MLLSAGAGGHTGWANPFAFARAVHAFWGGPLVLAGGVSDGTALWAAITLGYDLGYLGTKLIATHESGGERGGRTRWSPAPSTTSNCSTAPNGVTASMLTHRGQPAGSAGHTVAGVTRVLGVAGVVAETKAEWDAARAATLASLR